MGLFSRYKRPIASITGMATVKDAAAALLRRNGEEAVRTYVECVKKAPHGAYYGVYYDKSTRTAVTHVFFRGGALFGAWFVTSMAHDLNALAAKYGLGVRVQVVSGS